MPSLVQLLVLVACAAGLGSFVYGAMSFGTRAGNGTLEPRWFRHYASSIVAAVVISVYTAAVIIRGEAPRNGVQIGQFTLIAFSALVGLVSGPVAAAALERAKAVR
jgi:FtsH-binding integral membrane protein